MSEDEAVEIKEGSVVRLRIIGLNIDAGVIVSIYFCFRIGRNLYDKIFHIF
jgi:hypothetical protein